MNRYPKIYEPVTNDTPPELRKLRKKYWTLIGGKFKEAQDLLSRYYESCIKANKKSRISS